MPKEMREHLVLDLLAVFNEDLVLATPANEITILF